MPYRPRSLALALLAPLALLLAASAGNASGFGLFQHGGRATGQAGAFVARAVDPLALAYNPAGLVHVTRFELQAGLDFAAPRDDFAGPGGEFAAKHQINLTPAIYLAWRPDRPGAGLAFGLGLDAVQWDTTFWQPAPFPDAEQARRFELRLFELHPAVAYELGERWSVGGGLRYLVGDLKEGRALLLASGADPDPYQTFGERLAEADVDGFGFDLGAQYRGNGHGFGVALRSAVEVEGSSDVTAAAREFVRPQDVAEVAAILAFERTRPSHQSFELAPEIRAGAWFAPYPELRLELDLVAQLWAQTDNATQIELVCVAIQGQSCGNLPRDWDDTVSFRLGVEGELATGILLYGGLAWEPSPVPDSTREPGAPHGDAIVYAVGASYEFPQLSFDVGYSWHDHESVGGALASGRYSARDQVFAASARWRF
jgi:long-chain fatty acid transport protein